jgi:hypothetical protein
MDGRAEGGLFAPGNQIAKGNRGSPGRPPRSTEEKYRRALSSCLKLSDWKAIISKAIEQAKGGDKDARRFLASYAIGNPTEHINTEQNHEVVIRVIRE